jgi:hypothetical protein
MPVTQLSKTSGAVGDDIVITGSGFANATGVRFTGANNTLIPAAQLVESDTSIRATVPPNAISGPITIIDPDGNHVSPMNFTVLAPSAGTLPENTPRGREALNALVLAMAAKQRGDKITVAQTFDREAVFITENRDAVLARPSGPEVTPAQVANYQDALFAELPSSFTLEKMIIAGTSVFMWGNDAAGNHFLLNLKQTGGGFVIYTLVQKTV